MEPYGPLNVKVIFINHCFVLCWYVKELAAFHVDHAVEEWIFISYLDAENFNVNLFLWRVILTVTLYRLALSLQVNSPGEQV